LKKIVYLIEQPLDERNFDRFGIQAWIDRNWIVEVWDLTPLAHPGVWRNFLGSNGNLKEFSGYFPIASKGELNDRYLTLGRLEHFIDLTGENYCSIRVKASLIQRGSVRVICAPGSIPEPQRTKGSGLISKLWKAFAAGPTRTLNTLCTVIVGKLTAPLIRPGLAIVSGEISLRSVGTSCETIMAHSFDYDFYLKLSKSSGPPQRGYAVFVDQDLCFHSDFIYQRMPFVVTPEKYFPAVCRCLKRISRALNLELRIAAHPRASYRQRDFDYFEGVPISYGRTAELIKDCRVVVCHDSTAIHFAVLFDKPMIFVTSDELIPKYEGRSIAQAAAEFGKSAINLDADLQSVDWQEEMYLDSRKYAEYKNKYIKMDGSPERPMWDVVIDHIEKAKEQISTNAPEQCASAGGGG
jgi:hypothetical protein